MGSAKSQLNDAESLRGFSRSLPMALLRARESVMDQFRAHLRQLDVTEQQWRILRALLAINECNASELSKHTCISMPSLSRILTGLESRQLIERFSDHTDLRSIRIRIRAPGKRIIERGAAQSEAIYDNIAERFGSENVEQLYELLDLLCDALGTSPANTPEPSVPSASQPGVVDKIC